MEENTGVAQARYAVLETTREPYLRRARTAAALTVPHLMPPDGHTGTSELPTPFQSLGARGVRNLSSKLLLALFPPHQPFFRYQIDDFAIDKIEQEAGDVGRGDIEKALNKRERTVMKESERSFFRTAAFEVFRQLLVAGNALIYVPKKGSTQTFKLNQYVCSRDSAGTPLEIVLKQSFAPTSLPEEAQALLDSSPTDTPGTQEPTVDLYTYIKRELEGEYIVYQEVNGKIIPGTTGTYTEQLVPWKALRFSKIDGEDYGRGYVEEFIGDLISLEGLQQTLVEGIAAVAKVVIMVAPNGTTNIRAVSKAENGQVISGNVEDVSVMQAEKRADFGVAREQIQDLSQRLAFAFLLNTAIQRPGERVTAQEIRYMAQELEDGLGGVYSLLAQEFQLPMVYLFEDRMEQRRDVPKLPKDVIDPAIVTGIDALGRGQDLRNLDEFLVGLGEQFGPEVLTRYIHLSEAITRRGVALGIDMSNLVKSAEEVTQEEQAAQLQALAQNLGPNALQAMGQLSGKQMDIEANAEEGDKNRSQQPPQQQQQAAPPSQ